MKIIATPETTPRATRCPSLGSIIVGGKTVGVVQCCLDAGHDERRLSEFMPRGVTVATPHRAVLEWENDTVTPDLDLLDPAEELVDPLGGWSSDDFIG